MPDLPRVPAQDPIDGPGFRIFAPKLDTALASDNEKHGSREGPQGTGVDLSAQQSSPAAAGAPNSRAAHILRLQSQLANVSDYLSELVSADDAPPSSSLMFKPNILRSHNRPNKPLYRPLSFGDTREAELERENEQLKRALRIQTEISSRQRRQKEHNRAFEPPPAVVAHGIDPQVISELANDLICGLKTTNDVASTLLDLVERAGGTTVEKEREILHPLVRLNNAEGVLDITMDRVTALEKDTKSLKRSADWEAYRHIEASCRD